VKRWSLIEIEWEDAWTEMKQAHDSEYKKYKPVIRKTVGYVLVNDKERVTVAGTDDRQSQTSIETNCADVTTIPKGMVKAINYLDVRVLNPDVKNVKENDSKDYPKGDSEGGPGSTRHPTLQDLEDRLG
jgi:hypothetical protein